MNRKQIWTRAANRIRSGRHRGLCSALMVHWGRSLHEPLIHQEYRRLLAYRKTGTTPDEMYWWPLSDRKSRIAVAKRLAKGLKPLKGRRSS